MPKSSATIEVFCSPSDFMSVITDYEKYGEFVDEVTAVEILEKTDTTQKVKFNIEVSVGGIEIKNEYVCQYTITENSVSWTLVSSPVLTANHGSWSLREGEDEDETVADYEAEIITSLPIPEEVQKMFADEQLPAMMDKFRDRAEELFG